MYYNFVRIHQTLKVTPAMAAGVTNKLWEMSDLVAMIEAWEAEHAKTGTVYEVAKDTIGDGYHVRRIPAKKKPRRSGASSQNGAQPVVTSCLNHHPPRQNPLYLYHDHVLGHDLGLCHGLGPCHVLGLGLDRLYHDRRL
jgi:hypothetical protein